MSEPMISRRAMLRGSCGALALPWLASLARGSAAQLLPPARFVVLYVPNGIHMDDWSPSEEGPLPAALPHILEPLAPWREKLLVLSGLSHDKAKANGDGPGDHARAAAAFLTAAQPRKTSGRDLRAGLSFDQVLAREIGRATPFPSLELAGERGRQNGDCDSGYACVYSHNLAWSSPETPLTPETDPRQAFDRLFGFADSPEARAARAERIAARASLLDYLREDARALSASLGASDKRKLDQYLEAVRELERKILALEEAQGGEERDLAAARPARPDGFEARALALAEVLALSLATDRTRVATWLVANEGSNRTYKHLGGLSAGHHEVSHHDGDPAKQDTIRRINRFHAGLLAHFLRQLDEQEEEGGSLLDRSVVLYGSGIADGNSHAHTDLPLLLAGGAALGIRGGRHVLHPSGTPAANLFLALAERFAVELESFGDATGRLGDLG